MMAKYKKNETSPEALERVMDKNIVIEEGVLHYSDYVEKLKNNIPEGLKGLFKGELKEELATKHFKDYLTKIPETPLQGRSESEADFEKRKEKYVKDLEKAREKFKVEKPVPVAYIEGEIQRKIQEFAPREKTYFPQIKLKQKSSKGKEYTRTYAKWTPQQLKFIESRVERKTTKQITNEYNNHFGLSRSVSSIQTMKTRLKRKN